MEDTNPYATVITSTPACVDPTITGTLCNRSNELSVSEIGYLNRVLATRLVFKLLVHDDVGPRAESMDRCCLVVTNGSNGISYGLKSGVLGLHV